MFIKNCVNIKTKGCIRMIKMVSNTTETSIEDVAKATPETQVQVQVQAATEAKVAKRSANGPGKKIRNMFYRLVKENKLDEATVANLQDEAFTKEHLGKIKYAFLKKVDEDAVGDKVAMKSLAIINGHPRYTTKNLVEIAGAHYMITNDLYARNVKGFKDWCATFKED